MAENPPNLPQYSGFKGIPTPDQLGMGMNPYKAAGLLRKVSKAVVKPGRAGTAKISAKAGGKAVTGGRSVTGGKK